jgi:transposase
MLSMDEFKQIIKLRNKGQSQKEIANRLGVSERTVRNYLKNGKIPVYQRNKPTRGDNFEQFVDEIEKKLERHPSLSSKSIYNSIKSQGYTGSYRTTSRKTEFIRKKVKSNPVFFEREHIPGEYIEGDFTTFKDISIAGELVEIKLWVTCLVFSSTVFATPFFGETFECFVQGSIDAFTEFGGLAQKYRLDNLSPCVSKILKRGRKVTQRFQSFQKYYDFKAEFCNPGSGHEKGSVESLNRHLKNTLREKINLQELKFKDIEEFKEFVWKTCRELNSNSKKQEKFNKENLSSIPSKKFEAFQSYLVLVNKYSTFTFAKTKHRYSAPSKYVGLSLEARVYPHKVLLLEKEKVVATHKRLFGKEGKTSIYIEHIIEELCKKPGAVRSWKHRHILFSNSIWNDYFIRLSDHLDSDQALREYLRTLKLFVEHGRANVTTAMELVIQEKEIVNYKQIRSVITNDFFDPMEINPIHRRLDKYDEFLKEIQ